MKLLYLKSALKCDSFDVAIDIKIQFFRLLVTIEPDRSLLQFVTTNCLKNEFNLTQNPVNKKFTPLEAYNPVSVGIEMWIRFENSSL